MGLEPFDINEKEVKANDIALARSSADFKDDTGIMGSDECDVKDEECSISRMTTEAHLDYIYTKP
ncbi:Phytosulfokine [Sesbania bispinosa]|nr:Phytosulfokine [Sesbania bispinosa]